MTSNFPGSRRPPLSAPRAVIVAVLALCVVAVSTGPAAAMSAKEINIKVDVALQKFRKEVSGANAFLKEAKGVLVFPRVIKAGFGVGGEYGEGARRSGENGHAGVSR